MKPHKHAEFIKAWADGAQIQYRTEDVVRGEWQWSDWKDIENPSWFTSTNVEYRVKPEPKPDIVIVQNYQSNVLKTCVYSSQSEDMDNQRVKWTLDGETGRIKSVELLDK